MSHCFVAIDVETANADLASICQIGVVRFQDGEIAGSWKTLVDPEDEFDHANVSIHGIDAKMVVGAPTFAGILDALQSRIAGSVVVSHTLFDRAAIGRACERYGLPAIECAWLDSAQVTRRTWPRFSRRGYNLANIASWCGIEFRHHDAEEDARAAGLVLLRALKESGLTIDDWVARSPNSIRGISLSTPIVQAGNPDGPLAGEVVVFTGALSIPRREATVMAAAAGCDVASAVGEAVTLLVVGDQDVRRLRGREKSAKHRAAESLMERGQSIRILQESDFRKLIGG